MEKENKTQIIKTRITEKENEKILEYCEKNNIKRAVFLRLLIENFFNKEEK